MKIKYKAGYGKAVMEFKQDNATLEEAIDRLNDPRVIQITVTKMTTNEYLKKAGPINR